MEAMDKHGIVCFVGESPYGERVFYLKHHGYFKLPSGMHFSTGHLVNKIASSRAAYQNADQFIELFEMELYRLWQINELKTIRANPPSIYIKHSSIGRITVSVDVLDISNGVKRRSSVTRTLKPSETIAAFANRVRECHLEVLSWWNEQFITTPRKLLEFSSDNPLDGDYPNPALQFKIRKRSSNRYLKLAGYTKYKRPIFQIRGYGYFIAPAGISLTAIDHSKVHVFVSTPNINHTILLNLSGKETLVAGLGKALEKLAENGPFKYHTAVSNSGNIRPSGRRYVYAPLVPIKLRDGHGHVTSPNERELIIRRAADSQWIKDNLETTDIKRALRLHKEIPKDPM